MPASAKFFTVSGAKIFCRKFRILVAASSLVPAPLRATSSAAAICATASLPVTPMLAIVGAICGKNFAMSFNSTLPALPADARILKDAFRSFAVMPRLSRRASVVAPRSSMLALVAVAVFASTAP